VEDYHGIRVLHPRYCVLPKIGMTAAPLLLAIAARSTLARIRRDGFDFDLIDAHYFYPDGVAAAILGRSLDKPVLITARGTDVTLIPRYRMPRRMIRWAANQAAGIVTVSASLKAGLVDIGVAPEKIQVLRNGVDLRLFHPTDRSAMRESLRLNGPTLLSVGHLIKRKGHDLVIRALAQLPEFELLIAGDGPEEPHLRALAAEAGVANRVRFLGSLPQAQLRDHYGAVDALVLASSREGWANVLLEAMACGTPVVATAVDGTPEVVTKPEAGVLVQERTADALAGGIRELFRRYPDRGATRRYAARFSWDETTSGQLNLFERVAGARPPASLREARMER
jgi:glycosyltransferase involved in cell wall biosynthesis